MAITSLTKLIGEFRVLQSKDAVSPESLGYLLQRIVDCVADIRSDADANSTGLSDAFKRLSTVETKLKIDSDWTENAVAELSSELVTVVDEIIQLYDRIDDLEFELTERLADDEDELAYISKYINKLNIDFYDDRIQGRVDALDKAMPQARKQAIIDMWQELTTALGANIIYGYDATTGLFSIKWRYSLGEVDAYQFTDLSYEEVVRMLLNIPKAITTYDSFFNASRTNIIPFGYNRGSGSKIQVLDGAVMVYNPYTEVLMLSHPSMPVVLTGALTLSGDNQLRAIIGKCSHSAKTANPFTFVGKWSKLEYIRPTLRKDFDCSTSPLLTLGSFEYMVEQGAGGITITVHPDVYAKLTDETNAEWHKVLTDATAKNITFATTE